MLYQYVYITWSVVKVVPLPQTLWEVLQCSDGIIPSCSATRWS